MFLTSSADRFRSARPGLFPAVFACVALASHSAYGQFDPAKILAPLKLDLPTIDGKTIELVECVDRSNYTFGDEDPQYLVDRKDLFGKPFEYAEVETGFWTNGLEPKYVQAVVWDDATILRYFDFDPAIFTTVGRTPPVLPGELESLRQGKPTWRERHRAKKSSSLNAGTSPIPLKSVADR